jgi:hypothetical protein
MTTTTSRVGGLRTRCFEYLGIILESLDNLGFYLNFIICMKCVIVAS